jgi:hypothetical protein
LLESSYGVGASSSWNLYTTHLSLFEKWYRLGNQISNLGTATAIQAHKLCTKTEIYNVTSTEAIVDKIDYQRSEKSSVLYV